MQCPYCHIAMETVREKRVEIDFCQACQQIWLDFGELSRVAEAGSVAEEFRVPVNAARDHISQVACPRCGPEKYLAQLSSSNHEIELLYCADCAGVLINSDELDRIASGPPEPETVGGFLLRFALGEISWLSIWRYINGEVARLNEATSARSIPAPLLAPPAVQSDLILATPGEVNDIRASGDPANAWEGFSFKGLDNVKLATLLSLLTSQSPSADYDKWLDAIPPVGDEGPQVFALSEAAVQTLAKIASHDGADFAKLAQSWRATEEFAGWSSDEVHELLEEIGDLAETATLKRKSIFLWMSS